MALTNVEVVSVPVTDQDAAKSFYTEKLGFSVEIDNAFAGMVSNQVTSVIAVPPPGGRSITQRMLPPANALSSSTEKPSFSV